MIPLEEPIIRLVIKDLIKGDGLKKELDLNLSKIKLLEQKVILKDSIIFNFNSQIGNFESIIKNNKSQLLLSKELNNKLQIDLKKQKIKNKLLSGTGVIALLGVILLVK